MSCVFFCVAVPLGQLPTGELLADAGIVPVSGEDGASDPLAAQTARQASSLLALLNTKSLGDTPAKAVKVWLGEGLGSIPKRTHDRMLRWEFMDLADFRPFSAVEKLEAVSDTEKLVVLPGFEVSQVRRRPVTSVITWVQCFCRYAAGMSSSFPTSTPGFMAHLLTVLRAYCEVDDPAWRLYDVAFREKMAATGVQMWTGADIQLYQEFCGGRSRRLPMPGGEARHPAFPSSPSPSASLFPSASRKRPLVCWAFNANGCRFQNCKFAHVCESCGGGHPRSRCPRGAVAAKRLHQSDSQGAGPRS